MYTLTEELTRSQYAFGANCTLSSDCLEVTCSREDILSSQLILLPCFSPPAVRIILSGVVSIDYIFYQSEEDIVDQTNNRISVTLEHFENGAIGLEVCIRTHKQ